MSDLILIAYPTTAKAGDAPVPGARLRGALKGTAAARASAAEG
jgi:hypothetical protein